MADLSIKNLPEQLYRELKRSAKRNHRSMNREAAYRIELGLQTPQERSPAEVREIVRTAGMLRRSIKGLWLTTEEIIAGKNQQRP